MSTTLEDICQSYMPIREGMTDNDKHYIQLHHASVRVGYNSRNEEVEELTEALQMALSFNEENPTNHGSWWKKGLCTDAVLSHLKQLVTKYSPSKL